MSKLSALAGSKGYEVRDDERSKGLGDGRPNKKKVKFPPPEFDFFAFAA